MRGPPRYSPSDAMPREYAIELTSCALDQPRTKDLAASLWNGSGRSRNLSRCRVTYPHARRTTGAPRTLSRNRGPEFSAADPSVLVRRPGSSPGARMKLRE